MPDCPHFFLRKMSMTWKLILQHLQLRFQQNTCSRSSRFIAICLTRKKYNKAKACSLASINWLKSLNRRTLDVLASRLFFYYLYSYELTGDLVEICGILLALHHTASLHHDELG